MSIKREDERYTDDPVKNIKKLFDRDEPDKDDTGAAKPRMRIVGDMRDPKKKRA